MKPLIDLLALFIGVLLAYIVQNFLPPMADLHGAHVLLVPMVFCYAAIVLPFPAMLAAAIFTGFLSDLVYLHVVAGKVEIPIGYSIIFFVLLGCFANGFRSSMESSNSLPFIVLSAIGTSLFLFVQFVLITYIRGGIIVAPAVGWRILAPGLIAGLIAPLFYWTVSHMDRLLPDGSRKLRSVNR